MSQDQQRERHPIALGAASGCMSRRGFLARLTTFLSGFSLVVAQEPALARKKRRKHRGGKHKHKRKRKKKGNGGGGAGGGNGGGGGNYRPDNQERAFLGLINDHRRANGRGPLSLQNQLGVAAERHSQDQAGHDRGGHDGSDGSDAGQRITRAGYDWRAWGENVYWNSSDGSARAAFAWWKNSSRHNANMLSRTFTEIGVGRAQSESGWWYWTTTFGDR